MVSDKGACSVMAKMKLVTVWVEEMKNRPGIRKLKKEERRRIEILRKGRRV